MAYAEVEGRGQLVPSVESKSQSSATAREWLVAGAVAAVIVLLLMVPYWIAYRSAGPDSVFTGIIMNPEDSQTYFAKMRAGWGGAWLYRVPFTAEPHEPVFVGVFYITLGQVARLLGLTLAQVWHYSRLLSGFVLFLAIFAFVNGFVATKRARWTAYLLAVLGSGLGWLLFLVGEPYWLGAFPVDFKMPEARPFFTALTFPHIAVSTTLMLASFWATLRAQRPGARWWQFAVVGGICNTAIAILHPLLIYVVVFSGIVHYLFLVVANRGILWREGFAYAIAFLMPAPVVLYYVFSLATNDVFSGWNAQRDITLSPPWPHFLIAFGPLLLLAGLQLLNQGRASVRQIWHHRSESRFLWAWIVTVALLVYAPLSSQRRFVQGVHIPLTLLAAVGLLGVVVPWLQSTRPFRLLVAKPRYSRPGLTRLILILAIGFFSLSNLYILGSVSVSAGLQQPYPLFRPRDETVAAIWLREQAAGNAVVLGAYQTGNFVGAQAGNPVIIGHWAETGNFDQKSDAVARFYAADTADSWRLAFLQENRVSFVWHGPQEKALGNFDPASVAYLDKVLRTETISLYKVR